MSVASRRYVLIASRPRCGSNMLREALATAPGVCSLSEEPFHPGDMDVGSPVYKGGPILGFLEGLWKPEARIGVILLHDTQRKPPILEALLPIISEVIVLYREDTQAQYASILAAQQTKRWVNGRTEEVNVEVKHALYHYFSAQQAASVTFDKTFWFQRVPLPVSYEQLCGNWRLNLNRIGQYIRMDLSNVEPVTTKNAKTTWRFV